MVHRGSDDLSLTESAPSVRCGLITWSFVFWLRDSDEFITVCRPDKNIASAGPPLLCDLGLSEFNS